MLGSLMKILAGVGGSTKSAVDDFWYSPVPWSSGSNINEESAIRFSTVFACIQKICKTISTLPVGVYEKVGERQTKATQHPLNDILDWKGGRNATGVSVRSSLQANRLAWGDGVAETVMNNRGEIEHLEPLMSRNLKPKFDKQGYLVFEHWPDGKYDRTLGPKEYFHDPGPFTWNGVLGVTPIQARGAIVGAISAETYNQSFFDHGAVPGGILEVPEGVNLSDERLDYLVERFNERFMGARNAHRVGRLREGITFKELGMPNQDAQLLELRKFNRIEICSIFDVPPPMIQELDPGKYTAIEQAMIAWVKDSLLAICKATETALKRRFFADSRLYVKHNLAGLARGDMKARSEFYKAGIEWGWFTVNDVREMEELNPVEGGDTNWIQMNMMALTGVGHVVPARSDGSQAAAETARIVVGEIQRMLPAPEPSKALDTTAAFLPLFSDAAERITTKEAKAVKNALKRHQESQEAYLAWCDDFFTSHVEYVKGTLEPVVCGLERATETSAADPADFAARYAEHQLEAARAIPGGAELDTSYLLEELKNTYLESKNDED